MEGVKVYVKFFFCLWLLLLGCFDVRVEGIDLYKCCWRGDDERFDLDENGYKFGMFYCIEWLGL